MPIWLLPFAAMPLIAIVLSLIYMLPSREKKVPARVFFGDRLIRATVFLAFVVELIFSGIWCAVLASEAAYHWLETGIWKTATLREMARDRGIDAHTNLVGLQKIIDAVLNLPSFVFPLIVTLVLLAACIRLQEWVDNAPAS